MNRNRIANVVVALMVIASVGSAVSPVGTAAAASETYQFSGSPEIVAINVTGASGDVTVEFSTEGGPASGSQVIARTTVDAGTTDSPEVALANLGAYDSVNATVTGTGVSNLSTAKYGGRLLMPSDQVTMLGGTGGDPGFQCGLGERAAKAIDPSFTQLDCTAQPGSTTVNTTDSDAQQVGLDLTQAALNDEAAFENWNSTISNNLEDSKTVARVKAKNAYIRALNNGSSKAAAKSAAKEAKNDYLARWQNATISEWERQIADYGYRHGVAESEAGLQADGFPIGEGATDSGGNVNGTANVTFHVGYYEYIFLDGNGATLTYNGTVDQQVTLANGKTVTVDGLKVGYYDSSGSGWVYKTFLPSTGKYQFTNGGEVEVLGTYTAGAVDSTGSAESATNFEAYESIWTQLDNQEQALDGEIDTLANNTYSAYTQGEINNSDLMDPYVLASEYSPGSEYQGWAAAQLTLLGQNNPDAMESIGYMNVTDETDNTSYQGVLMSPSNPSSGEFAVNSTYDASTLSGQQYIVTDSQIHELTGNFTLTAAQTHSGESVQNVTMYEKQYTTTNVTELQQLYDDLSKTRAEIEAREQNLLSSGGGGLLGSSSTLALVVIAGGAVYLLGREERGDP